jgi:hypothetical protein
LGRGGGTILKGFNTDLAMMAAGVGVGVFALKKLTDSVVFFASKANPAAGERWGMVWDDLFAVVGRLLVPVLESMTSIMRGLADTLADAVTNIQHMDKATDESWIGQGVKWIKERDAQMWAQAEQALGKPDIWDASKLGANFMEGLKRLTWVGTMGELGGWGTSGASQNAAGRPAKFSGIGELMDEQLTNSFSRGGMTGLLEEQLAAQQEQVRLLNILTTAQREERIREQALRGR